MRLHCLRHVEFETLGYINSWAATNNIEVTSTNLFEYLNFPAHHEYDFLCILGCPMNIYEYDKYHWLKPEKKFISEAINEGKKILGICLGAQLLADQLGSNVYRNSHKEIGWFDIVKTDDGNFLTKEFPNTLKVLHWHGDTFSLPKGAVRLFKSEACENQAFLHANNILGLQFHIEMTSEGIQALADNCKSEIENGKFIQSFEEIVNNNSQVKACNNLLETLLNRFLF